MLETLRTMPGGIRMFLVYALAILAIIGLSLRYVVDLAVATPITIQGVAAMALLAYTIFTITAVIQRKQAARGLALGLASLTIVAVPFLLLYSPWPLIVIDVVVGILLFRGLTRPAVRDWLSEP
jgi:hypothetical protein